MPETTFDVSHLQDAIKEYERNGGNLDSFYKSAENVLVEAVDHLFDTEGNGKWKQSLRAQIQGGKTLENSGILAGSIRGDHGEGWVSAGTNVPYSVFHLPPEKSGHPVTTGIMPVRDFLDVDEEEVFGELADLLATALVRD